MTSTSDILETTNHITSLPESEQAAAVARVIGCTEDMIVSMVSTIDWLVDAAGINHAKFAVLANVIAVARGESE